MCSWKVLMRGLPSGFYTMQCNLSDLSFGATGYLCLIFRETEFG
jgi:hypothetical protein